MVTLPSLIKRRAYSSLTDRLRSEGNDSLAQAWPALAQMEKLIIFKLMEPGRALEFFGVLPFEEKYFLYCGAPLETITPVLEDLPASERRLFHQLPRGFAEKMFRRLLEENRRTQVLETAR